MGTQIKKKLSLVTYNTLGTPFFAPDITKRDLKIGQIINESTYDIVCLQELFTYYQLFLFRKNLSNYPYCIYQKNPLGPRGGLVIFSKLPFSDKRFFTYSRPTNATVPSYVRLAQPGILSAQIDSFGIRIATTHLSSDTVHDLSPKDRLYNLIAGQAQEAANITNKYTEEGKTLVLTGDFNIAKHSTLFEQFLTTTQVTDIFEKDEQPTYDPERVNFFYQAPANRIDFIFTKAKQKKINPTLTEHIFTEQVKLLNGKKSHLSDHIGLHSILEIIN